jgi:preprotein translocase subunit YajC
MTAIFAFLPAAAAQASGGAGMSAFLFQMIVIFALAYFLFIRPQQRQRRAHEERIKQLKRGDHVVSAGGLVGEVVHINVGASDGAPAPTLEDHITIKTGDARVVIERGRVQKVTSKDSTAVEEKGK